MGELKSKPEFEFEYETIERLGRENAELRLDRDAWVEQHHNRTKLIDDLQAKLAAAEAEKDDLGTYIVSCALDGTIPSINQAVAAIDAAKTEVKA